MGSFNDFGISENDLLDKYRSSLSQLARKIENNS
jgi:hypothetical protein